MSSHPELEFFNSLSVHHVFYEGTRPRTARGKSTGAREAYASHTDRPAHVPGNHRSLR
jgi:hypothetical protein